MVDAKPEKQQLVPRLAAPSRVGQGTAVEQSRAAAEVLAAVEVAQRFPRDIQAAVGQMRDSCKRQALAERAFFRYPRSDTTVSGPSVHLARELARIWGHVQYGLIELRRDDKHGQSEMQAYAWDMQTNSRNSSTFIVPHRRDTKYGPKALVDLRDVYENNANHGARRVREAVFNLLPPWFVEEAKEICSQALKNGGGQPLAQRIATAIDKFGAIGVTTDQLEQKVGRPSSQWTEQDTAQLGVIFTSLERGEISKEEEFPQRRVTAAEVAGPASATRARGRPTRPPSSGGGSS